jgi:hypothetical protein
MHAPMAGCLRARTRRWARIEQTTVLAENSLTARVYDDLLRQDLAAVRRGHFFTIAMTAPGPKRPLSFRGSVTATDPQLPDDVCKGYGDFIIIKPPVSAMNRLAVLGPRIRDDSL